MDFEFTPEQKEFQAKLHKYLDDLIEPNTVTPVDADTGPGSTNPHVARYLRKMGEDGWLSVAWPVEYGGQGKGAIYHYIVAEEMALHNFVCPPDLTSLAFIIMKHGTEEQKAEYLPKLRRFEIRFALGYSEPHCGSDLAALRTRAVEDEDGFLINGQKMYTTYAHSASHFWLLARTDPAAERHRGLSVFLLPMDTPGMTVRPLWTIEDTRTNEVFLDNVRLPRTALLGEKNRGWYVVAGALDIERVGLTPYNRFLNMAQGVIKYAKETKRNGQPLSKDPVVRQKLAEIYIDTQVVRLLNYRTACMIDEGRTPNYEASAQKVFATELMQRIADAATQVMGLYGQLQPGSTYAPQEGRFERLYRSSRQRTVSHGTSQVQRNIIATRGLGLPR